VVLGSLLLGLPVGLGLGMLAVRVLSLFFALPPPLLTVPAAGLLTLTALVLAVSALSLALAMRTVARIEVAPVTVMWAVFRYRWSPPWGRG
jgi:putative ABC transport system permease protein